MSERWISFANEFASMWGPALLRACWQGGLFILAVWLVCRIFRSMPASAKSWLWWIASLQMLLRLAALSALALPLLPARPSAHPAVKAVESAAVGEPTIHATPTTPRATQNRVTPAPAYRVVDPPRTLKAETPRLSPMALAMGLWLVGIAACLTVSTRRLLGTRRLLEGAHTIDCGPIFDLVQEFSIDHGTRQPRLMQSDQALCPLLAGWGRPAIVMPSSILHELDANQVRMAVAHEFAHLQRRDLWLAIIPALTQSVFYFNPLAWLATHEGAAAREAACDSAALRISGGSPAAYARLLLDTAQSRSSMAVLGTAFGYRLIQRRITMLKTTSLKNTPRYRAAWAGLIAVGAICALPWSVTAQSLPSATPPAAKSAKKIKPMKKHASAKKVGAAKGAKQVVMKVAPHHPLLPTKMGIAPPAPPAPMTPMAFIPASPSMGVLPPSARVGRSVPAAPSIRSFGIPPSPSGQLGVRPPAPGGGPMGAAGIPPLPSPAQFGELEISVTDSGVFVHCDMADIRDVLKKLFDEKNISYMIKSDVKVDTVTCSLKNVPVDVALQTILSSVKQPLTYKVEAGVYKIEAKDSPKGD